MKRRLKSANPMGKYEYLEHTADLKIYVLADSLIELFSLSAEALFNYIYNLKDIEDTPYLNPFPDGERSKGKEKESCFMIEVSADDIEQLLVNWLKELLYVYEIKHIIFSGFNKISDLNENYLKAEICGEKIEEGDKLILKEVKAVTYHQLEVKKNDGKWTATFLVDI